MKRKNMEGKAVKLRHVPLALNWLLDHPNFGKLRIANAMLCSMLPNAVASFFLFGDSRDMHSTSLEEAAFLQCG